MGTRGLEPNAGLRLGIGVRVGGFPHPHPHPQAFHEGGVAGVVEGLAPKERRLPPLECLRVWVGGVVDEGDGREIILREKKTRLVSVMF